MTRFKAVGIGLPSGQATGRTYEIEGATREEAIQVLLSLLGVARDEARVPLLASGPGSLVQVGDTAWCVLSLDRPAAATPERGHQRRGGSLHRPVR